jgi:hypothetical protein
MIYGCLVSEFFEKEQKNKKFKFKDSKLLSYQSSTGLPQVPVYLNSSSALTADITGMAQDFKFQKSHNENVFIVVEPIPKVHYLSIPALHRLE